MSAVDPGGPEPHVVPRLRRSIPIGHRAEALRRFGHSAHDAEFLTFAALLGGYFERRHCRGISPTGCWRGENVVAPVAGWDPLARERRNRIRDRRKRVTGGFDALGLPLDLFVEAHTELLTETVLGDQTGAMCTLAPAALLREHHDRSALKVEPLAQLVGEIAFQAEVEGLAAAAEEHERWWPRAGLRDER